MQQLRSGCCSTSALQPVLALSKFESIHTTIHFLTEEIFDQLRSLHIETKTVQLTRTTLSPYTYSEVNSFTIIGEMVGKLHIAVYGHI